MFNLFKKSKKKANSSSLILSSSGKKKSFFDIFKVNGFILFSFIVLIWWTAFLFIEVTKNKLEIDKRSSIQATNYSKLREVSNTLWYLNWLKVQKFEGSKVVKILEYLESLELYSYTLEFNSNKQYFFVNLKSISNEKLTTYIDEWVKSWTLNYFKTNETIKVTEEGRVSVILIFN